jgi:hypothetical protein
MSVHNIASEISSSIEKSTGWKVKITNVYNNTSIISLTQDTWIECTSTKRYYLNKARCFRKEFCNKDKVIQSAILLLKESSEYKYEVQILGMKERIVDIIRIQTEQTQILNNIIEYLSRQTTSNITNEQICNILKNQDKCNNLLNTVVNGVGID